MTEEELQQFFVDYGSYMNQSSFVFDFFRMIGKVLINMLKFLCDKGEELLTYTYQILDFTEYEGIQNLISDFRVVGWAILTLSLAAFGYWLMAVGKNPPNIVKNIGIFLAVTLLLPTFIASINSAVARSPEIGGLEGSSSNEIISQGIVDLLYADRQNQMTNLEVHYDGFSDEQFKYMSFDETVNEKTEGLSKRGQEIVSVYYQTNSDGEIISKEFGNGNEDWYYRYDVDWLYIYLCLSAYAIAMICSVVKASRLIYEITISEFIAPLYASDLTGGQKTLKIMDSIKNNYIVLVLISVFLQIFRMSVAFIQAQQFPGWVEAFLILFLAFALIDGPNIIERITGVDAGLKSGFGKLASAYAIGKTAAGIGDRILFGSGRDHDGHRTGGIWNNTRARSLRGAGAEMLKTPFRTAGAGLGASAGNMVGDLEKQIKGMQEQTSGKEGAGTEKIKPDTEDLNVKGKNSSANITDGDKDTLLNKEKNRVGQTQLSDEKAKEKNTEKEKSGSVGSEEGKGNIHTGGQEKQLREDENAKKQGEKIPFDQKDNPKDHIPDNRMKDLKENTKGSNMIRDIMGEEWKEGKDRVQAQMESIHQKKNPIKTGYQKAYERTVGKNHDVAEDKNLSIGKGEKNSED